jgi:hypothetical protein
MPAEEKHHLLKSEHEALRATLKRAMRESGKTGELARELAALADGHFLLEEKFALPLLALLPDLAVGESKARVAAMVKIAAGLRAQLPQMREEHRQMAQILRELSRAAEAEGHPDYVAFAEDMILHAHEEEEILYPAALVAGDYLRLLSIGAK